jgi:GNAT superfamily N-acetyltransferase
MPPRGNRAFQKTAAYCAAHKLFPYVSHCNIYLLPSGDARTKSHHGVQIMVCPSSSPYHPDKASYRGSAIFPSFAEIGVIEEFIDPELRTIARHSKRGPQTIWYRVIFNGREVAFVAIDRLRQHFVLLQLFVPRALRGKGIGSAVLRTVEALARSEGYGSVRVWPRPIDRSVDLESLGRWYRVRGYRVVPNGAGDMEKQVVSTLPQQIDRLAS